VTSAGASSSASSTASPSPSPVQFQQTGTVKAQPPPKQVACGAKVPAQAANPKPQYSTEPPMKIDTTKTYTATFKTSCGTIVISLDAKSAPHTVNSFVFLAQHQYFDGQYFTRLDTSIDVVQGGDPTGSGSGGPGYSIPDELHGGETYDTGVFAMAKTAAPNSGGSQFFIITGTAGSGLNASPNYTIFGRIISGLAIAQKIQALPILQPNAPPNTPGAQQPKNTVYIDSVTITVK
jgi:cyclophilin family peptidyl-prolyl cis-trans isomerase